MAKDGVDKLNELMSGGAPPQEQEPIDEEFVSKMNEVLELISKLADDLDPDSHILFSMQSLLGACTTEIQIQIQEMTEGDDDGE